MSIDAEIVRRTRKGDWIARTPAGIEILLPRTDTSLDFGLKVSLNGIKQGDHINFPDGGYGALGSPGKGDSKQVASITPARPTLYNGIIISDHSYFSGQTLYDHWGSFGAGKRADSLKQEQGSAKYRYRHSSEYPQSKKGRKGTQMD